MSRTKRNRHGYVWWKVNPYYDIWDAKAGKENISYSWHQMANDPKASRHWRKTIPANSDGMWSETGRRSGLKERTSYERRNNQRRFLDQIKKEYDVDDMNIPYPCEKETKYLWWCFF